VHFLPPLDDGGAPVLEYIVRLRPVRMMTL